MSISILLYLGFASMNGLLLLFYAQCGLAAAVGLTASGLTCSRVVSESFVASRGLSLAIARSGLAVTSALLPTVLFAVILQFGWRAGYVGLAALVACLALPTVDLWIGRAPIRCQASPVDDAAKPLLGWRQLLGNRRVLLLCLAAGLSYAPANAIMSQLQPLLVGKGIARATAANMVGAAGAASVVGALVTGVLVDRFWAPAVALVFACGSAAGTCLLALNGSLDGLVGLYQSSDDLTHYVDSQTALIVIRRFLIC